MGVGRERMGEMEGGRNGKTEFVISAFSELTGCYCRWFKISSLMFSCIFSKCYWRPYVSCSICRRRKRKDIKAGPVAVSCSQDLNLVLLFFSLVESCGPPLLGMKGAGHSSWWAPSHKADGQGNPRQVHLRCYCWRQTAERYTGPLCYFCNFSCECNYFSKPWGGTLLDLGEGCPHSPGFCLTCSVPLQCPLVGKPQVVAKPGSGWLLLSSLGQ